jgi:acetyl-CoA C-acetyltransferase
VAAALTWQHCRPPLEDIVARSDNPSVIVAGARTPIGKLAGALKDFTAMDLGGIAIEAALERSGVRGDQVDYVIMGHVLQAGQGQITARQAAVKGGVPMDVPAVTINKVCLSGLDAIALADQLIRAGEVEVVVAGGMESMTNAPYLLPKARQGYRYGNAELLDATFHDGLFDAFDHVPMGEGTERHNARYDLTREEQDEFAARSHELAAAGIKDGRFADEIVPVSVPQRKGDPVVVSEDEGVRPGTTAESLGKLRPAFTKDGAISAGNASQISDGAAAVVVMSRAKAEELGLTWLAEIGAHGIVAGPDNSLQEQPANAIRKALAKDGLTVDDIDLFELNEAFAAVGIASTRALGVDPEKVNPNGGAIALGHPIGASGARIVLHLAHELKRRGGGTGAAALCGGGGQGDALIVRVPAP